MVNLCNKTKHFLYLIGEELTISYMSPLQRSDFHTRDSRQKILQDEFGFYCQCNLCSVQDILDLEQNDLDRTHLLDIEQKWIHLGQDPCKVIGKDFKGRISFCRDKKSKALG